MHCCYWLQPRHNWRQVKAITPRWAFKNFKKKKKVRLVFHFFYFLLVSLDTWAVLLSHPAFTLLTVFKGQVKAKEATSRRAKCTAPRTHVSTTAKNHFAFHRPCVIFGIWDFCPYVPAQTLKLPCLMEEWWTQAPEKVTREKSHLLQSVKQAALPAPSKWT